MKRGNTHDNQAILWLSSGGHFPAGKKVGGRYPIAAIVSNGTEKEFRTFKEAKICKAKYLIREPC